MCNFILPVEEKLSPDSGLKRLQPATGEELHPKRKEKLEIDCREKNEKSRWLIGKTYYPTKKSN
jgi:hypothetical protein